MSEFNFNKVGNETELQYLWRIGTAIEDGVVDITWEEITPIINKIWRKDESEYRTSSAYRKKVQYAIPFYKEVWKLNNPDDSKHIQMLEEMGKARVKAQDERTELRRLIKEQARKESFLDTVKDTMASTMPKCQLKYTDEEIPTNIFNSMIIHLSDLHAGIGIKNQWNTFNEEILADRLAEYLAQLIDITRDQPVEQCCVVLGGDLISGVIHSNLRLENNQNVIEQIKLVSMHLANFIDMLSVYCPRIDVYSVAGNHSRVFPQKEQQLKGEYLDELVAFNLGVYFKDIPNITVHENEIDDTVASFECCGHLWYAVHGDKDSPSNIVQKLTLLTGKQPDGILMGHRHKNCLTTESRTKIVESGSLCGMDNYCIDHRLVGQPEQMVVITNKDKVIKCLYDIQFKN